MKTNYNFFLKNTKLAFGQNHGFAKPWFRPWFPKSLKFPVLSSTLIGQKPEELQWISTGGISYFPAQFVAVDIMIWKYLQLS